MVEFPKPKKGARKRRSKNLDDRRGQFGPRVPIKPTRATSGRLQGTKRKPPVLPMPRKRKTVNTTRFGGRR